MPDDPHSDNRLNVVLCWHMHQPEYRNPCNGANTRPWTYLRAIKDYTDMAAHLEQAPNACAVVNFAPILLEQIDDYARQIDNHSNAGKPLRDPLLAALVAPHLKDLDGRQALLQQCLSGHPQDFARQHRVYARLIDLGRYLLHHHHPAGYADDRFFYDLLVWHHLAWLGETVRRNDPRVQRLLNKGHLFSLAERRELLGIIGEQIAAIVPRYRALAESGRIELAMSPYAHPLAPLLLTWHSAREANPDLPLPNTIDYPGGEERLRWHIDTGLHVFKQHFGIQPIGCWPAEGALSDACLRLFSEQGFQWTASGSGVLFNSLNTAQVEHRPETALYHGYKVANIRTCCFFRDDQLSDLIGFTYASWHADDAVANLVHHLEKISNRCAGEPGALVAIIMDGENAWEHYPNNGFYFLQGLYNRLANHPRLHLTTFSHCLSGAQKSLPQLVAGSWVHGNLTTWIGSPDKNRAWEMLVDAKQQCDEFLRSNRLRPAQRQAALRQLAVCEGSDWFWWPGGDNPAATVADFDSLYRLQLTALYQLIGKTPPDYLARPFTHQAQPSEAPLGGVMRKAQ